MDFSILVILWIAFLVLEKIAEKKKKKVPPPNPTETSTNNASVEIPTLANDPNFPGEDVPVFKDEFKPAEIREKISSQPKTELQSEKNFRREDTTENKSNLPLNLNPDSAMNAIVLSEIFGKPKALQRK